MANGDATVRNAVDEASCISFLGCMNVKSEVHRLFRPRTVFPSAKTKNTRLAWSNVPVYILPVYNTAVDTALTLGASALRVTGIARSPRRSRRHVRSTSMTMENSLTANLSVMTCSSAIRAAIPFTADRETTNSTAGRAAAAGRRYFTAATAPTCSTLITSPRARKSRKNSG